MSRILLTWELGLNHGHLARLLPVAQQLKADGHTVLVATRDIQAASLLLAPAGIPFIQAPHLPKGMALPHRPGSYADILLSQGWIERQALYGLTHAWLNLLRLFKPERMILDYSPTVSLAARIAAVPTLLIGNGFELPPLDDPLPPFPRFSWATHARAIQSDGIAVGNANAVLHRFGAAPLKALRDLIHDQPRLLVTYLELDHYGERPTERYVGPLLPNLKGFRVDWPQGSGPKIFATLRPDTSHVREILTALADMNARVICIVDGFNRAQLEAFNRDHILFSPRPVDLAPLRDADLCITYGAEGTTLRFLLAGVPQLIAPWHVEAYMALRRVVALGCGLALIDVRSPQTVTDRISELCAVEDYTRRARSFSERHGEDSHENTVRAIAREILVEHQHHFDSPTALSDLPSRLYAAVVSDRRA